MLVNLPSTYLASQTPSYGNPMGVQGAGYGMPNYMYTTVGNVDLGGGQNEPGLRERAGKTVKKLRDKSGELIEQVGLNNPANRNMLFNRSAMLGGVTAIPSVIDQYQSGNTLGAAATAATAGLSTLGAGAIGGRIGGGRGALVTGGLSILGGLLAPAAGDLVGKATGKGDSQGAARTRMTKDAAAQAKVAELLTSAGLQPYIAAQKDLMGYAADIDIQNLKRQAPIIKEQLDNALVRQQALNASNAQNYMAMGTVATAGKLAVGAQEQAGANYRTAITSNPYANNVLQAPSINFG